MEKKTIYIIIVYLIAVLMIVVPFFFVHTLCQTAVGPTSEDCSAITPERIIIYGNQNYLVGICALGCLIGIVESLYLVHQWEKKHESSI